MKIFHIVNGNDYGGAMTQITALINQQQQRYNVALVAIGPGQIVTHCREMNLTTYQLSTGIAGILQVVAFIKKQRAKDTVFHVHGLKPMVAAALSKMLCKAQLLATIHSDFYSEYSNRPLKYQIAVRLIRWSIRRIDYFVTVSDKFLKLLYAQGVAPDCAVFIANGIDLSLVRPAKNRAAFLKQYNIVDTDQVICGIAARLHPVKGIEMLIDISQKTRAHHLLFLVAGIGEKNYVAQLKEQIKASGQGDRIIFLGFVNKIYDFYNAIDINLLTSYEEGVSYAVMESGALAKPTVSTDVSGLKTLIENGENGLVVPIGDSDAFARALTTLVDNREMRHRLGENLRQKINAQFTNEVMASKYDGVYQALMEDE